MLKPDPILVTGATGSIGSALVKRLVDSGRQVRAVVRNPDRAAALRSLENVQIFPGDLSHPESLQGCAEGCSLVYHFAAKLGGSNWQAAVASNVTGTRAILDEAIRGGVGHFVYTSTIGVYGLCKDLVIDESTAWTKLNLPYFTTKQQAEEIVWQARDKIPLTVARLGDVFGPGQVNWTIDLIKKSKQGVLIPLLDSESGYLNPIFIENLVDALLLLGNHPGAKGQIFNVVDGFPIRTSDFFRRLNKMACRNIPSLPGIAVKAAAAGLQVIEFLRGFEPSTPPGSINYLMRKGKIYPEKIKSLLGWSPTVDQEDAFRITEEWLRKEGYIGREGSSTNR